MEAWSTFHRVCMCVCVCVSAFTCTCVCDWVIECVCTIHCSGLSDSLWIGIDFLSSALFCSLWLSHIPSLSPSFPSMPLPFSLIWLCISIGKADPLPSSLNSFLLSGHLSFSLCVTGILHRHYWHSGVNIWHTAWMRVNVLWLRETFSFDSTG